MNTLNELEMVTCQIIALFKGIGETLRSYSQLYIKRMSSLSHIFNRFVTFTLCIKIALRNEGDSMV